MTKYKGATKALLIAFMLIGIFILLVFSLKAFILPILPSYFQNWLTVLVGASLLVLTLLAGFAQITGYSLRDFLSQGEIVEGNSKFSIPSSQPTDLAREKLQKYLITQGAIDVFPFSMSPEKVVVRIHEVALLNFDDHMKSAFEEINRLRESHNKNPYYANSRYRVIKPPYFRDGKYIIDVGEADFAHIALLVEPDVPASMKNYVRENIRRVTRRLPKYLHTDNLLLNGHIEGQLGIQMVLVTQDGYTLLRKRGQNVLEYKGAWDVSFSGYCGQNALMGNKKSQLNLGYTARFELEREIGIVRADPRDINFTALHINPATGTTVLTGYWKIQEKRNDLAKYLNKKFPQGATVFETTELANENYVWDNMNMLVEFNGPVIAQSLTEAESLSGNESFTMLPAASTALLLALHSFGKSTNDLAAI